MKARAKPEDQTQYERAFGMIKPKRNTEWRVHKNVCRYLKDAYPAVRFYSTLDGFDLGNQRAFVSALQWREPGVPDLFIFQAKGKYSMLVIEIKREGEKTAGTTHLKRQSSWLKYLSQACKAYTTFGVGYEECKNIIDKYMKL